MRLPVVKGLSQKCKILIFGPIFTWFLAFCLESTALYDGINKKKPWCYHTKQKENKQTKYQFLIFTRRKCPCSSIFNHCLGGLVSGLFPRSRFQLFFNQINWLLSNVVYCSIIRLIDKQVFMCMQATDQTLTIIPGLLCCCCCSFVSSRLIWSNKIISIMI